MGSQSPGYPRVKSVVQELVLGCDGTRGASCNKSQGFCMGILLIRMDLPQENKVKYVCTSWTVG